MARKISVEIVGDATSLERAFKKSSRSAKNFQGDMSKTGTATKRGLGGITRLAGLATGALGVAGLAGAARAAFTEMADAQKVTAQTNAVLKSTGKAANVSAKHVDRLAESLLNMSGVDDEAIKSGENLLLTFTNVRNEVGKGNDIFDQATKTMLDMSVALGQDTKQSAIQLGKALNDPIKGVGALRRVGVSFTNAQQDQIKALTKSGHVLEAQKLILRELQKEFGGSARAAGKTLPGQLNILRETMLNLGGSIAATLTPAIQKVVQQLVAWLSKSKNQKQVLDTVQAAASAVSTAITVLSNAFTALNSITGSATNTFKILLATFVAFKALKLVAYIASMTKAMRGFAAASAAANAAGAGGGVGGAGRFGRVLGAAGSVAVGAPLVATAIRQTPGWDQFFKKVGGKIFDVTHRGDTNIHIGTVQTNARTGGQLADDLARRSKQRHPNTRRGAR